MHKHDAVKLVLYDLNVIAYNFFLSKRIFFIIRNSTYMTKQLV